MTTAPDIEIEIVDRPEPKRRGREAAKELTAVMETARTGKAVRIAVNGRSRLSVRGNLFGRLAAQGLFVRGRLHTKWDGPEHFIAWLDPEKAAEP